MCITIHFLQWIIIWCIVIAATIAIINILVPWLLSLFGAPLGPIAAIIRILLWAIVAVEVVYIVFALLGCLGGSNFFAPPYRN